MGPSDAASAAFLLPTPTSIRLVRGEKMDLLDWVLGFAAIAFFAGTFAACALLVMAVIYGAMTRKKKLVGDDELKRRGSHARDAGVRPVHAVREVPPARQHVGPRERGLGVSLRRWRREFVDVGSALAHRHMVAVAQAAGPDSGLPWWQHLQSD